MKRYMRDAWFPTAAILISSALTIWAYPELPDKVPTHWSWKGSIDGYGDKWPYAFIGPIMGIAMLVLFNILPKLDPKSKNYDRFTRPYIILRNCLVYFASIIGLMPVASSLGWLKDSSSLVFASVGLLLTVFGNYMGQLKQNWYAGIKTPWTLSNETVWNKTHRFGGKLWFVGGLISTFSAFLPRPVGPVIFTTIVTIVGLVPVVYSYIIFREETRKPKL